MRTARGFTLLELLISLVILATLTVFSSRAIQQALFSKTKIQMQIDEMSAVRDALKIMERDVNLAFHYRDMETEFRSAVKNSGKPASGTPIGQAGQPGTFAVGFNQPGAQPPLSAEETTRKQNRIDPVTEFEGKSEAMDFVTLNTGRIGENEAQADFIKVGYAVKGCKRIGGKQESTKCLIRRSDTLVEGDVTKGGEDTVLLENVSEFKLRYYGKGKQDWVDTWSSKEGDDIVKGNYPAAVEISLTTENGNEGQKKRTISMQIVAQVRFPNNPPKGNTPGVNNPAAAPNSGNTGAPGGSGF